MEVQLRVGKFFVRKKQKLDIKGELAVSTWRRAWQPTLVFLSGESPWTEEPVRLHTVYGVTKIQT